LSGCQVLYNGEMEITIENQKTNFKPQVGFLFY
jgi:hypothetical protein